MAKASLNEIMGKRAGEARALKLDDLPDILGEAMPELPRNSVGRHRLVRALQQRFGNNFRNLPGVDALVKDFDDDIKFEQKIERLKKVKPKRSK